MNLNFQGAVAAVKAYQSARRGNVSTPAEILRRSSICFRCPQRQMTRGVSKASEMLGILANRHRVPPAVSAYSCKVCGCSLQLLLPAVKEDIHRDTPEEAKARPKTCWILDLDNGT